MCIVDVKREKKKKEEKKKKRKRKKKTKEYNIIKNVCVCAFFFIYDIEL
jgi:hypothetical protein